MHSNNAVFLRPFFPIWKKMFRKRTHKKERFFPLCETPRSSHLCGRERERRKVDDVTQQQQQQQQQHHHHHHPASAAAVTSSSFCRRPSRKREERNEFVLWIDRIALPIRSEAVARHLGRNHRRRRETVWTVENVRREVAGNRRDGDDIHVQNQR